MLEFQSHIRSTKIRTARCKSCRAVLLDCQVRLALLGGTVKSALPCSGGLSSPPGEERIKAGRR